MAVRSLGQLTIDLALKTGLFDQGMDRSERELSKRTARMKQVATAAGAAIGTALAAGATTAAVAVKKSIDQMDELSKAAQKVQLPTEEMSKLAYAGELADVALSDLTATLGRQAKAQAEALDANSEQAKVFRALGISVTDTSGKLRNGMEVFQDFADAYKRHAGSQEILAAGMKIYGKNFQQLIPLLKDGSQGLRDAGDEAERFGRVISTEAGQQAEQFNDNLTRMQGMLTGVANAVATELLPDMTALQEQFIGNTTEGGKFVDVASDIADMLRGLATVAHIVSSAFEVVGTGIATVVAQGHAAAKFLTGDMRGAYELWKASGEGFDAEVREAFGTDGNAKPKIKIRTGLDYKSEQDRRVAEMRQAEKEIQTLREQAFGPVKKASAGGKKAVSTGPTAAEREAEAAREAMQRYADQAKLAAAALQGPYAEAVERAAQEQREWAAQVERGHMAQADMDVMVNANTESLKKLRDELDSQAAAEYFERMEAQIGPWRDAFLYAIDDVGMAFGDLIGSGLRDWDRFGDDLKDITKNFLADIATQFAQQQWLEPMKKNVTDWLSGVMNGNGFAAGGKNIGGNWMQSISNWAGSLFGGGTTAAAGVNGYGAGWLNGGTWAGLGSAATGAGGGATGAAGGAAAGAGGMASAIPIIGWIVAGMMANSDLYKKGWSVEGQESDILKSAMKGTALGVPLFGPGAVGAMGGVMLADKTLRALGLDGKTASMLSGSSILAKAFGRKAPQVQGQGISGSYGFGGLDGSSFADIKQKGGWFRSDKKWTQYSALDSDIDMAFDSAAMGVRAGATALAKQLGIDVTAQLARVRVDIGKMTLDKDSEIARQQLEKAVSDMMERLSAEAIKALGFTSLLNDGFAATDTMTALSSVLELVDGNAAKATLGMEYFQRQANELGTDLATQAERIGGILGDYGSLIGDVDAQLRTAGLSDFQRQALDIETTYRDQVKSANELAKALGLSGARSEDLAKIEQLRAVNMGRLTAEMERQRNSILDGLALSEFAPSTDAQKLTEAMSQLQAAVASGDIAGAGALAQSALGLGRNLYASGNDYNALYGQVTGMIGGMGLPDLDLADGTTMGDLADILLETPRNIAQELFALLYTPTTAPGTGNSTTGGNLPGNGGLGGPDVDRTLREILDELRTGNRDAATAKLRETLNARAMA